MVRVLALVRGLATKSGGSGLVRLDKYLNDAGAAASRAACGKLIKQGRVRVDGEKVAKVGGKISSASTVTVDGAAVEVAPLLWAYHKPVGVQSTVRDERGRPDLSGVVPPRAHPVGRLDADTSGLLLFSSDGGLTHKLLSPRHGVEKEYVAECDISQGSDELRADPGAFLARALDGGVETALGVHRADVLDVAVLSPTSIDVRLVVREGKHRMVRRMLANVGCPVTALRRERFGSVGLGSLESARVVPVEGEAALAWARSLLPPEGGA